MLPEQLGSLPVNVGCRNPRSHHTAQFRQYSSDDTPRFANLLPLFFRLDNRCHSAFSLKEMLFFVVVASLQRIHNILLHLVDVLVAVDLYKLALISVIIEQVNGLVKKDI